MSLGFYRQGTRDADPLALTSGELVGEAVDYDALRPTTS